MGGVVRSFGASGRFCWPSRSAAVSAAYCWWSSLTEAARSLAECVKRGGQLALRRSPVAGRLPPRLAKEERRDYDPGSLLKLVRSGSIERHESAIVGYRIAAEAAMRLLAV